MNEQVVYLIRHASPQYPVDHLGRRLVYGPAAKLSVEGEAQCLRLARDILQREGRPLDLLMTSPYTRAEQTASLLAGVMGINTIIKDNRLRDTDSSWKGVLVEEFMAIFFEGKTFDDPRTLETLEALGARMKAAYDEMMHRDEGKRIGIISHGDPLRALWFRLSNPQANYPPYLELTKKISLDAAQGMRIQLNPRGGIEPDLEFISGS